jgi:hypothetical protein
MSRDDAKIIAEVERKLLSHKLLPKEVQERVKALAPHFIAGDSWDKKHCRKLERLLKKAFGEHEVNVSVSNDVSADFGGYRIHVTPLRQLDTIHFTIVVD